MMKLDRLGMAVWLAGGAVLGGWELWSVLTGRVGLTLSYQVWTLFAWSPAWLEGVEIAGFGAAASALAVHFFRRRT